MNRTSIAVLLGGPSAEHDVSLVSGRAIAAALIERGHDVQGWLVDLSGRFWQLPPSAMDEALPTTAYDDPTTLDGVGPLRSDEALHGIRAQEPTPVVFIALHGPFGEDGTIQALCEAADLVYTGSGVAASAIGMDKSVFKRLCAGLGMPVVPSLDLTAAEWQADPAAAQRRLNEFAAALPDPRLVVKPTRLGSSVGIAIVHKPADPEYLGGAIIDALSYGESVLVEAYQEHARELEMSIVGNSEQDLESYGPGEIFPGREFYDYVAKYRDGMSRTSDRADIDASMRERIHDIARRAYVAIGASGFSRVDFLLGGGELYLNEINTIPGFTPISLFPIMCREGAYDFADISEKIVELALERDATRPKRVLTRADLP
ncbi:MAG: D-alanine--D-alanine ligase [Candidatus Limnocylindrales bacterium]